MVGSALVAASLLPTIGRTAACCLRWLRQLGFLRSCFPGYFHAIRPGRGPGSPGLGSGGNREVLRDHQGITVYVQRRSVQTGIPFGFHRKVLMFMSIFFFLICSVSPRVVSGGLLKTGFTLGFTRQCFAIIQGITEYV